MVKYAEVYKDLIRRAMPVFEALVDIYASDVQASKDWATISVADAENQLFELNERLNNSRELSSARVSTLVLSMGNFLDRHWADYIEFPKKDSVKRKKFEGLYSELESIINDAAPINNALR